MEEEFKNEIENVTVNGVPIKDNNNEDKKKNNYHPVWKIIIKALSILLVLYLCLFPIIWLFLGLFKNDRNDEFYFYFEQEEKAIRLGRDFYDQLIYVADEEYRSMTGFSESYSPIHRVVSTDFDEGVLTYVVDTHTQEVMEIKFNMSCTTYASAMYDFVDLGNHYKDNTYNVSIGTVVDDEDIINRFKDNPLSLVDDIYMNVNLVCVAYTFNNPDKVYVSGSLDASGGSIFIYTYLDVEYTVSTDTFNYGNYPKEIPTDDRAVIYFFRDNLFRKA